MFFPARVPALVALALWVYVYATGPSEGVRFSAGFLAASVAAYFVFVRLAPPETSTLPQAWAQAGRDNWAEPLD